MVAKRIIACLDVKGGRVVKGVSFTRLRDAGDPVELARAYDREGADELVFLDISATNEERETTVEVVRDIAANISIPFTVGGGIRSVAQMEQLLRAGADKVSLSTAAVEQPQLIAEGARKFGGQRIVVAIDARYDRQKKDWFVYTRGGQQRTALPARAWAERAAELGAGELLLTSMNRDGHKNGYDVPLTREVATHVAVPVIASGGAGSAAHFVDVLTDGKAAAALAASIFHFREVTISEVKARLKEKGVAVRC
ncbi:imidazole glycerol phosphate synthase subunit HisF [Numidum massiliense]|uniref:imidazole glycerol phosphate synthase subunit HisF n=1 Tax=Numidum massiliense TaxID=1522315 RepID=UPI0006D5660A|nr:imidazole glycerol phosphate synthase subunit HisF [Numidum massiliense]